MIEIIIHGRGGSGGKKLSKMIAQAAFLEKKQVQSFALYGAERRGAPVTSFVRIDDGDKPIELRGYITNPDYIVVLNSSLYTEDMINPIVNSSKKIDGVITIDANKIAMEKIGKVITNTTMLGAVSKITGLFSLESSLKAIDMSLPGKIADKNKEACIAGYGV